MNQGLTARVVVAMAGGVLVLGSAAMPGCASRKVAVDPGVPPALRRPTPFVAPAGRSISQPLPVASAAPAQPAQLISTETLSSKDPNPGLGGGAEGFSPAPVVRQPGELLKVKYTTNGAPVAEVLHVLIGDMLKRPFVVDPRITGALSMDIDEEMTRAELIDFIGTLASVYDWAVEERDGVLIFRPAGTRPRMASAPVTQAPSATDSELPVVRVRRLKYASAAAVQSVLKEVLSEGGKQIAVGQMIVVVDTQRQANRAAKLISALDVSAFDGVTVWTFRLGTRSPDDAKKTLDAIASGSKLNTTEGDPLVSFIAISGSDRLLVLSRDPTLQSLVRTFVEQVDQPADRVQRERYLYRIQNYDPAVLLTFLNNALGDKLDASSGGGAPLAAAVAANAARIPGHGVRLVLEPSERILMVEASPADYAEVLALLKAIDRPRMQVFVNTVIAEVSLKNNLEFGVQYFFQGSNINGLGVIGLTGSPGALVGKATGSAFLTAADGLALVQALQKETRVDILSQPRVFVRDNTKATIDVGGEQPVAKSSADTTSQSQGSTIARTDIDYKSTGVKLELTPTINETGMVKLKLNQVNRVLTAPDTSTQAGQISPAFQTRTVETEVVVPSGQTLVLGGIIDRRVEHRVSKIPILGNLPLIGAVFQTTYDQTDRTELLLTVTPTIVAEPSGMTRDMSDFIVATDHIREVLAQHQDELPHSMLSNPDLGFFSHSPVDGSTPGASRHEEGPPQGAPTPAATESAPVPSPGSAPASPKP